MVLGNNNGKQITDDELAFKEALTPKIQLKGRKREKTKKSGL